MENLKSAEPIKYEKAQSISHALAILNDAAQDSSDEIRKMVNKDFRRIKETFSNLTPEIKGALREVRNASSESLTHLKDASHQIDHSAHENPWIFVGTAAAVAGVMGFVLGRKTSN